MRDIIRVDSEKPFIHFGLISTAGIEYGFKLPCSSDDKESFLTMAALLLVVYAERDINAGSFDFKQIIDHDFEGKSIYRLPFTESLTIALQGIQLAINTAALEIYKRDDLTVGEKATLSKQRSTDAILSAMARTGKRGKETSTLFTDDNIDPWQNSTPDNTPPDAPRDIMGIPLIVVAYIDSLWKDTRPLYPPKGIQPGISYEVARTLNRIQTRGAVVLTDNKTQLIDRGTGRNLARVMTTDTAVLQRLSRGADELSTMNSHHVIRYLLQAGHYQASMMPDNPEAARVLDIEHGWEGLYQRATGCPPKMAERNAATIKDLILLLKTAVFEIPHVSSGLLDFTYFEPGPGKPSMLRLTLNDVLMPGFVNRLAKGSKARWIVPMPERLPLSLCGNCFVLSGKRVLTLEALRLELHPAGDRRGQERRSSRFTRRYSARREPFERRWIATDAREGETRRASGERRGG